MIVFNAFQIVIAFVAWPFLIQWLNEATFRGAGAAFWAAIVCYVVAFFCMVASVAHSLDSTKGRW